MIREKVNLCKKHPYYKAIRKPRVNCFGCFVAYYNLHGFDEKKAVQVVRRIAEMKYGKKYVEEQLDGKED